MTKKRIKAEDENRKRFTDKEWAFIGFYMQSLNGTQAAIEAKYSKNTAAQIAYENLRKPHIREEIDRRMREHAMQPDEILYRLTEQARADMADFIRPGYSLGWIDLERAREMGITHLIKEFKRDKDGAVQIKLYDAQAALVHLAKLHAMFADHVVIEDWRSQAIADIRDGNLQYGPLVEAFDADLATQLFREAGLPIPIEQGKGE